MKPAHPPRMRERLLARLAVFTLRLLFATLRMRLDDRARFTTDPPPFPAIITFWHNRILGITLCFLRRYPPGRKGVVVLTSASRDGEILARIMAAMGMGSVRGSTSRRAAPALRECRAELEGGADLAVTPDGPRGPKYQLGPGLILLAQQTGARVMPVHARFHRAITLKTWDGFRVPLPFSRVDIIIEPYEEIPPTADEPAFESQRKRIEDILKNAVD